jgi:hypothetical protein
MARTTKARCNLDGLFSPASPMPKEEIQKTNTQAASLNIRVKEYFTEIQRALHLARKRNYTA